MNDALVVGGSQGTRDLQQDRVRTVPGDRPFGLDRLFDVVPLEELHHEVDREGVGGPKVDDVDDVLVLDDARRSRLPQEAFDVCRVLAQLRLEHLNRDSIEQADPSALVDGGHASHPQLAQHLVAAAEHRSGQVRSSQDGDIGRHCSAAGILACLDRVSQELAGRRM